jgi:hypothetical protein
MKTIKQFNISLIIRGVIIPIILLATLFGGFNLNQKIVALIDFGFTSKLATLSSTAGAFVRLDDHQILIQPRKVYNLRAGFNDTWLVLSSEGDIHELIIDGSVTLEPIVTFPVNTNSPVSFATTQTNLFTLDSNGLLTKWNNSGNMQLRKVVLPASTTAKIAGSTASNRLALGPDINGDIKIFDENLTVIYAFTLPNVGITDISFNTDDQLVVLTNDQQLISIDPSSGNILNTVVISCQEVEACATIHSIAFIDGTKLWGLSDALTLISSDGGIDSEFYAPANYHDHTSSRYLDYVIPMREIREKQGLTYLYSFILNDADKTISYVLDSSIDDDFTHIGYIDSELELDDYISATDVLLTTKAYVSKIKPWGQWGLVKIGFAPIYRPEGGGEAIMGADQNVSSIDQVSREALVILSLSSFVFLLFGATASWFIAKSLTSPLLTLKDNVLSIAAGFLDRDVSEPRLKDLRPLAAVFREAGDNLKKEVIQGPQILQKFEQLRLEQDYKSYLELKLWDTTSLPEYLSINPAYKQSIAWVSGSDSTLIWILKPKNGSPSDPLKRHNTVYHTGKSLMEDTDQKVPATENLYKVMNSTLAVVIGINHALNEIHIITSDEYKISGNGITIPPAELTHIGAGELNIKAKDSVPVLSISERSTP